MVEKLDKVCLLNNFNFSAEQHAFPFYFFSGVRVDLG